MAQTNFRASDFGSGSKPKVVASKRDRRPTEPQPTSRPIIAPDADPEDVPKGTAPEIRTWVGNDPVRAQKALDTELENAKPRKGLVAELQDQINVEAGDEPDESSPDEDEDN